MRKASQNQTTPKRKKHLRSIGRNRVDFQVFLLTALIVIVSCGLIFIVNYQLSYRHMITELQNRAASIHDYLELHLDRSTFHQLNIREDETSNSYLKSKELLKSIRDIAGSRYLYTAKMNENGELIYLVDGLPADSEDFRHVGNLIEAECIPDLTTALNGYDVLPETIRHTTWGSVFISYFPIHEGDKIIGAIGMEFDADRQYSTFAVMQITTVIIIALSCIVAAFIAVFLFRRISNPSFQDISNTDFLTKIKNRNAFEIDIHNFQNSSILSFISFISIDLDGLKIVNDQLGHAKGDEYIISASNLIQKCMDKSDILYRIGGDEFVILIHNNQPNEIEAVITRIRAEERFLNETSDYKIGLSIGYASFDKSLDRNATDTLMRSDAKMYENKKKRKKAR